MKAVQAFREWMEHHGFDGALIFAPARVHELTGVQGLGVGCLVTSRQVYLLLPPEYAAESWRAMVSGWECWEYISYTSPDLVMRLICAVINDTQKDRPVLAADCSITSLLWNKVEEFSRPPVRIELKLIQPLDERDLSLTPST